MKTETQGLFNFKPQSGGFIDSEGINGAVSEGKIIFTAGDKEYEGFFISAT